MGWGTLYKYKGTLKNIFKDIKPRCILAWKALTAKNIKYEYEGYLNRISAECMESELKELQDINKMLWGDIMAYAVATPPAWAEDVEGEKYPYPEFMAMEINKKQQAIEENMYIIVHIEDCLEAQREDANNVTKDY